MIVDRAILEGLDATNDVLADGIEPPICDMQQGFDFGIGIVSDGVQQVGGDQLELIEGLMTESNADLSLGSLDCIGLKK